MLWLTWEIHHYTHTIHPNILSDMMWHDVCDVSVMMWVWCGCDVWCDVGVGLQEGERGGPVQVPVPPWHPHQVMTSPHIFHHLITWFPSSSHLIIIPSHHHPIPSSPHLIIIPSHHHPILSNHRRDKIHSIATNIYGADGATYSEKAEEQIERYTQGERRMRCGCEDDVMLIWG